ncbi:MAG: hypothetical protein MUP27_04720 [Desulfobacterales bacterium]|nr:hypothetical protein [Desulfobacterales bacterium]
MRYLKMIGNSCLGGRKLNVRFYGLMKGTGDRVTPLRHLFTPLESPAACGGDEDKFRLKRTRGLMLRVSRPVRRAKLF